MVYENLSPHIDMQAENFSQIGSTSLGSVEAKYSIFGGPSSISLSAEKLAVAFPSLLPSEKKLAWEIIGTIGKGFNQQFSGQQYSGIQITVYEHAQIIGTEPAVDDYLARYAVKPISKISEEANAEYTPAGRFTIVDNDAAWRILYSVERSEVVENALFLYSEIIIMNPESDPDAFAGRIGKALDVTATCASTLDLEWDVDE